MLPGPLPRPLQCTILPNLVPASFRLPNLAPEMFPVSEPCSREFPVREPCPPRVSWSRLAQFPIREACSRSLLPRVTGPRTLLPKVSGPRALLPRVSGPRAMFPKFARKSSTLSHIQVERDLRLGRTRGTDGHGLESASEPHTPRARATYAKLGNIVMFYSPLAHGGGDARRPHPAHLVPSCA